MVVGHRQEDQVGGVGDLLRRVDRLAAVDARGEGRGRCGRAARDRDDRKAGLRETLRDTACETAGADEAEAGVSGTDMAANVSENEATASIAGMTAGPRKGSFRADTCVADSYAARTTYLSTPGHHGRFTILESDPEIYRTGVRLETSASCLEFVIVHYDRVPAARAVSGKTDRSSCRDPTRRTEPRGPQGPPKVLRAAPHGGSGRVRLQFATNARYVRSAFSLHCFHATCMPAVADRSA
ncbi:NADP oxidoreductase, coenzyme F420-dependent domain protein [Burkholderia cepacia]|nr:NADP oxidoreductase, coenzyme F420-dependent domain protein [Burkholderia cepacia]